MFATRLRALAPRLVFSPAPRPLAAWVVPLVGVTSLILLTVFVAKYGSRTPFHDEYANFHLLFGNATAADYWSQHNEHRIPLPRLVYVAAVKLAGTDFRAPLALNVVLLAAVTAGVLAAVRARRGAFALSDVALPLLLLGTQHFDNLLWGFQVQFVLSSALVLAALAIVARPGDLATPGRFAALGAIAAALPLCGANGAPPGLALAGFLVVAGVRRHWSGVVVGVVAAAVVGLTFVGLNRVPRVAGSVEAFVGGVLTLPGFGFGPASYLPHGEAYAGVTAVGVLTTVFLLATAGMLLRVMVKTPAERDRALAFAAILAGIVGLAVGISYGRSGQPRGVFAPRYVTLFTPGIIAAYVAWVWYGRGRVVPLVLAVLAVVAAVPNARFAAGIAEFHSSRLKRVEYEAKSGLPVGIVADRNPWLFPGEGGARRVWLELLRSRGVRPFDRLTAVVPLTVEAVPVRVLRTEGLVEDGSGYRVVAPSGGVVLQLPRRGYVYAVRLTYVAVSAGGSFPRCVVSWDRDGRIPPAPGYGIVDALDHHPTPAPTVVLIERETDTVRFDLFEAGTTFRVDRVEVLGGTGASPLAANSVE